MCGKLTFAPLTELSFKADAEVCWKPALTDAGPRAYVNSTPYTLSRPNAPAWLSEPESTLLLRPFAENLYSVCGEALSDHPVKQELAEATM